MFYVGLVVATIIAVNLALALSKKFSPIPYYPTKKNDIHAIIDALNLQHDDVLYDLGAGDGAIIMEAAKKKGVRAVGVEIHPLLVFIMHIRRLLHPNRDNIDIVWGDLFKTNLKTATVIYLFVGPFVMKKIIQNILNQPLPHLKKIVSYRYSFQLPTQYGIKKRTIAPNRHLYSLTIKKQKLKNV